jgi:ribose transport system permease protein
VPLAYETVVPVHVSRRLLRPGIGIARYGTIIGLVVMVAAFSALRPERFPTWSNWQLILNSSALLAIVASGLTVCLVLAEFDLSIGFVVSLGGIFATEWISGIGIVGAIALGLAAGAAVGIVNGFIVTQLGVSAFIGTLATGAVITGLITAITHGQPNSILPDGFNNIGQSRLGGDSGIPTLVLIAVAVVAVLWVFVNRTEAGRRIDATGGNTRAARLAGIRVNRYRMIGFLLSSLCASLAGVLLATKLGSGYPEAGNVYLLDAFTACFLGAVTFHDGRFNIFGTAIGVLILSVVFDGLNLLAVPSFWQDITKGLILILAVALSGIVKRIAAR